MKYYYLSLQIPGDYGENAVFNHGPGPKVMRMHFEFDLDPDAVFTIVGDYFVSAKAKQILLESGLSGIRFGGQIETSVEPESAGLYRSGTISYDDIDSWVEPDPLERFPQIDPKGYFWMNVEGKACEDDFGMVDKYPRLVVSELALEVLRGLGIPDAEVKPFEA